MSSINEILARPENKGYSQYGAEMGRKSQREGKPERLHLQRVRLMDSGGCYDSGGAYWGGPSDLWCAFSPDNTPNEPPIRLFVRAFNRDDAKSEVLAELTGDGWAFIR